MLKALETYTITTSQGCALHVSWFGEVPYQMSHQAMLNYASDRAAEEPDHIWLLVHPSVYTQGTACDLNTLVASDIPTIKTDRGGQITYHGPGQIVMYPLLHLKNHGLGVKALVSSLEQCAINVLREYGIDGDRKQDAPGVYVDGAKIAALGLRIRRGNSYHGLSLNVDMDLAPFTNIDPCGYQGLQVQQLKSFGVCRTPYEVGKLAVKHFASLI